MHNPPAFSAPRRARAIFMASMAGLLCALTGCSVIGGVVGHQRDVADSRTKIIPASEAASLRKGAIVYLTIPNTETLKGKFLSLNEENGKRFIHVRTGDGESKVGLGDVTEIVEEYRDNGKLAKGIVIGAAIDAVIAGGIFWIAYETQKYSYTHTHY